jgi:hypothetical protein
MRRTFCTILVACLALAAEIAPLSAAPGGGTLPGRRVIISAVVGQGTRVQLMVDAASLQGGGRLTYKNKVGGLSIDAATVSGSQIMLAGRAQIGFGNTPWQMICDLSGNVQFSLGVPNGQGMYGKGLIIIMP